MRAIRKNDLNEENPLSTDLEWMLQSRQAGYNLLVETLVEEYYAPLYGLALQWMNDPGTAAGAVQEAITRAVLGAGRYQPPISAETWLYREALEVFRRARARLKLRRLWKAFLPTRERPADLGASQPASKMDATLWPALDGLDGEGRAAVLLTYTHDWPPEKTAAVLKISREEVKNRLDGAHQDILSAAGGAGMPANGLVQDQETYSGTDAVGADGVRPSTATGNHLGADAVRPYACDEESPVGGRRPPLPAPEGLEAALRASLHRRWPEAALPPLELNLISAGIQSRVGKRDGRRVKTVPINELVLVGVFGLLVIALIWGSSLLLPEPARKPAPAGRTAAGPSATAASAARAAATATPAPTRKPAAAPRASTPSATRIPSRMMNYRVQPGDTLRSIAARLGVEVEELAMFKPYAPDEELPPGESVQAPVGPPPGLDGEADQAAPPSFRLDPIGPGTTPQELTYFLLASDHLWRTVWVEAQVVSHGPAGYAGPPTASRAQAWLRQPGQAKVLAGDLEGWPGYHAITTGGLVYSYDRRSDMGSVSEARRALEYEPLVPLLFPARLERVYREGTLKVLGEDTAAGRVAVRVEWLNEAGGRELRLWVDAERGLLLRLLQFGGPDFQTLISEVIVTAVEFDLAFEEPALFDPRFDWQGGFAGDYRGQAQPSGAAAPAAAWSQPAPGHEPRPTLPPPAGFDPQQSPLTFQYRRSGWSAVEGLSTVDLFAGEYHLGSLEDIPSPWSLICDRSADGLRVAFIKTLTSGSVSGPDIMKLQWFDLEAPLQVQKPLPEMEVSGLAFAPEGSRLALAGYQPGDEQYGIWILDTGSGELSLLLGLRYAWGTSLVWSPDGEHLALLGSEGDWYELEALVVSAGDGEIQYRVPVDWELLRFSPDQRPPGWPAPDWPFVLFFVRCCVLVITLWRITPFSALTDDAHNLISGQTQFYPRHVQR